MYDRYLDKSAGADLAGRQVLLVRTSPVHDPASPLIDNELVASVERNVRGTPVAAYAYIQRARRP